MYGPHPVPAFDWETMVLHTIRLKGVFFKVAEESGGPFCRGSGFGLGN